MAHVYNLRNLLLGLVVSSDYSYVLRPLCLFSKLGWRFLRKELHRYLELEPEK